LQVYGHLCTDTDSTNSTVPIDANHGDTVCTSQALRYNLMLTIAVAALNIACFPAGIITDRFGPRVAGIISSVIMSLGLVLFAMSSPSFDAYIPGSDSFHSNRTKRAR
jgi:MFS family permease